MRGNGDGMGEVGGGWGRFNQNTLYTRMKPSNNKKYE